MSDLNFSASIDSRQMMADIDAIQRRLLGLNSTVQNETQRMDSAFKNLGLGIAGYFSASALKGFTMELINVRGEFQKTEIAFTTMLGSADQAKVLMAQMVDLAAKTPFDLQDVSNGAKQLLAFQVPANEVVDTLTRMGNIAAGLSVPLSRINLVYGQVKAKGKLMGDDLRQFTEAGIPMVAELAKKFNKTTAEISGMVSAGKIGFKDVQDVLFSMTNEGGMFYNLMEKQSASLSGQIANLGDSWDQMLNKIGQSNEGVLADGIREVTFAIENYESLIEIIKGLILTYGAYRAALIVTATVQNVVTASAVRMTAVEITAGVAKRALTSIQAALNATILANPYALAAALIVGLTYATYKLTTQATTAQEIHKEFNSILENHKTTVSETKAKIDALVVAIKSNNTTDEKRKELTIQLNKLTNNKIQGLNSELIKTGQLDSKIKSYISTLYAQAEAMSYVDQLQSLYKKKRDNEDLRNRANSGDTTIGEYFGALFDKDTYKKNGGEIGLSAKELITARTVEEDKAIDESIENTKKAIEKRGDLIAEAQKEATANITNDSAQEVEKAKAKNKRDLAEIYSKGSIADLEQRISLWKEALQKASGDKIAVLDKNKFGDTINTGKTVSRTEALSELLKLDEARVKREKEINLKTFDEQLSETERLWKAKYRIAEFYGQQIADEQFPELKGSFYDDISIRFEELNKKRTDGVGLSDSEIDQWQKLKDILSSLTGEKDSLSNFNDSIDKALEKLPLLYDQAEYLKKLRDSQTNDGVSKGFYAAADSKLQEKIQEQRKIYQEFLNEQRTFEEKKLEIEQKYNNIRVEIGKNKYLTDYERLKQLDASYKKEGNEISELSLEGIKKTDLWVKAFGDLNRTGVKTIKILRSELAKYINSEAASKLSPEELKVVIDAYNNLGKKLEDNPFEKISVATDNYKIKLQELAKAQAKYGKDSPQFQAALENAKVGFVGIMEAANEASKFMVNAVVTSIDAFGEISDEAKKTINEVQNLVDGLVNAVAGYFSGNYAQMISGIVQMISALGQLLNGDDQKTIHIRNWQLAIDDLKSSYEQLQYTIEKTAGDAQLKMQRDLIANLKEQQRILDLMRSKEAQKKKADQDKIASYSQQIADINFQIEKLVDNFKKAVSTVDFREMSEKIADALVEAFGKGEDAAASFDKVVDDVMRNAVANALKIKILEPEVKKMVDKLYSSMGFGGTGGTKEQSDLLSHYQAYLKELDEKISKANPLNVSVLQSEKNALLEKIKKLQADIAANAMSGSFDGLTKDERDAIKALGVNAMNQYTAALQQYEDLFGSASENAQGLKGDIKGITEKTAGALEAQFNAVRINIVAILQIAKQNNIVFNAHTVLLSQIEINTRRLHSIDKSLIEMNAKMKKSLAGVP